MDKKKEILKEFDKAKKMLVNFDNKLYKIQKEMEVLASDRAEIHYSLYKTQRKYRKYVMGEKISLSENDIKIIKHKRGDLNKRKEIS